jgi:hypothetical protein
LFKLRLGKSALVIFAHERHFGFIRFDADNNTSSFSESFDVVCHRVSQQERFLVEAGVQFAFDPI